MPHDLARIGRLLSVVRRESGRDFDRAAVLQTIGTLGEALSIALLIPLLKLMGGSDHAITVRLGDHGITLSLPVLLAAFVLLVILRSLALERKEAFNARVTFGFAEKMTARLFGALAHTRWSVVNRWRAADMTQAVTGDGDRLLHAITLLLGLVQSVAVAAIFILLSLAISWQMTAMAAAVGGMLLLLTRPARRRSSAQGRELVEARRQQFRITDEFLNGLRTAKAFGLEGHHAAAMGGVLARIRRSNVRFMMMRARSASLFQIATAVAMGGFIYFALAISGLALEQTLALMFLYMRLAPRIVGLHGSMQELLVQLSGVEAVLAMLESAESNREAEGGARTDGRIALRQAIELKDVRYRYEGADRTALNGVSALFPANRITAIVGPTGSGKSTLVDIMLGLCRADEGSVLVDGAALSDGLMGAWKNSVAYVPQDTFLFNTTIAENLRIVRADTTDDELWEALALADAANFVRLLPGGLRHEVGDRGHGLSGGERQRLAIARALVRKPQLLILDEATSALDALSQRRVAEALRRLCNDMTVVAIAHRASMIAFADHVVVLENGAVAASGAYEWLAETHGFGSEGIDAGLNSTYIIR